MPQTTLPNALSAFDDLPDTAWVSVRVVAMLYGSAVSTAWRRTHAGLIPPPRKFGATARWNVAQLRRSLAPVDDVLASRRS